MFKIFNIKISVVFVFVIFMWEKLGHCRIIKIHQAFIRLVVEIKYIVPPGLHFSRQRVCNPFNSATLRME